ncbi:MAG: copper chaperone PCu(A)C [Rugosibacter sp.]|nr:copper chaperone PCu(A)C [Rugosibacter sp.]
MYRLIQTIILLALLTFSAYAELAQIKVHSPWIRPTVPQQKATGAFMTITSTTPARLVGITSPVAEQVEIHEMRMENDVMTMRAVSNLPLSSGKSLELKPGGYHVMLFGLHQQIKAGDSVPLTLIIEDDHRQRTFVTVQAIAKSAAAHSH